MTKHIAIASLFGLFFCYSNSNAQSKGGDIDLFIRKGIYLSFDDFIRNAPTVSSNFIVRDTRGKTNEFFETFEMQRFIELYFMNKILHIEFTNFNYDTVRFDLRGVWGFSTGEDIFVKGYYGWYRITNIDVLCQLEFYEKKNFFYEWQFNDYDKKMYERDHLNRTQPGRLEATSSPTYSNEIDVSEKLFFNKFTSGNYLNLKTGKIQYPSEFEAEVKKIVESDEQLFWEFSNDTAQYQSDKIKAYKYFLLYKERNPIEYPVVQ
jgi:hypothetical protein